MINIKVLENNFNPKMNPKVEPPKPKVTECEHCGSKLEYEDSDLDYGAYGGGYIHCPCCDQDTYIDTEEMTLTKDNVEFPKHFTRFEAKSDDKTCVTNDEVRDHIQRAIGYFRKNKNEDDCGYYMTAGGDSYFCTKRYPGDEEYNIVVAKGYWETDIPFEKEDYRDGVNYDG